MKTVIRRGIFETNSSSTHALTINKKADGSIPMSPYADGEVEHLLTEEGFEERTFLIKSPIGKLFMLKAVINATKKAQDPLTKKFWNATVREYRKMFGVKGSIKEHIIVEIYKKSYRYNKRLKEGWSHERIMKEDGPNYLYDHYDEDGLAFERYKKRRHLTEEDDDWYLDNNEEPWMLCSWFYDDEPLSDCTCQFSDYGKGLENVFHLSTCKNFAELARWYLADDIYLVGGDDCFGVSPSEREI
ncbi:MAG: hypothetical protein MJ238_05295 [Bacilli bacterium]|nr:hypothetical protein [Bacilli bacterium]